MTNVNHNLRAPLQPQNKLVSFSLQYARLRKGSDMSATGGLNRRMHAFDLENCLRKRQGSTIFALASHHPETKRASPFPFSAECFHVPYRQCCTTSSYTRYMFVGEKGTRGHPCHHVALEEGRICLAWCWLFAVELCNVAKSRFSKQNTYLPLDGYNSVGLAVATRSLLIQDDRRELELFACVKFSYHGTLQTVRA